MHDEKPTDHPNSNEPSLTSQLAQGSSPRGSSPRGTSSEPAEAIQNSVPIDLISRAVGEQNYRRIIAGLNGTLGALSMIFLAMQVFFWFKGSASNLGLAIVIIHVCGNLILSTLNKNFRVHTLKFELVRFLLLNQICAGVAAFAIVSPLHPFWCFYFVNAVSIGPALFDITGRRWRIICQTVNISAFALFYGFHLDPLVAPIEVLKLGLMIFAVGTVSELYLDVLHHALLKLVASANDIREKQVEILRKEKFLQSFIDHFPGLAYAKDPHGDYVLCNHAAREAFGENVIGKHENNLERPIKFVPEMSAAIEGVDHVSDREDSVHSTGSSSIATPAIVQIANDPTRHFAATRFRIVDEGFEIAECVIAINVSDTINAEKDLELNRAKMIAASKMSALGEMAGGVAHEINNPLAIIHGKAQKLNEQGHLGEIDHAVLLKDSEKIMTTVDRIARIVKALRSFSRDVAGTGFAQASVSDIVSETLELCSERFRAHDISFETPTSFGSLALECRSVEVCQILLNLLNNAHDAVEGTEGSWVKLEVLETVDSIDFAITDSGPGIPLELHDKILQPFFTTKAIGKGTGLGLSISIGLVESHNGKLTLDVASPHTRFVISLPKVQPAVEAKSRQIKAAA